MYRTTLRPVLDRVIAAALLLLASPIMVLMAVGCRIFTGSVVFRQTRIGKGGILFTILKFRSMRGDDHGMGSLKKGVDVERTPAFGAFIRRWRLDELPQLVNVLRGEMSLIGPRPLPVSEFSEAVRICPSANRRHEVLPGMAGLAQVRQVTGTDFWSSIVERIASDIEFVDKFGWMTDLKIILLSPIAFVCGYNARPRG